MSKYSVEHSRSPQRCCIVATQVTEVPTYTIANRKTSPLSLILSSPGRRPQRCQSQILSTDPSTSPRRRPPASSLLEAVFLSLVEQVGLRAPQVHDLGAPVSVLLLLRALAAVVRVRDARASTDGAPPLKTKTKAGRDRTTKNKR